MLMQKVSELITSRAAIFLIAVFASSIPFYVLGAAGGRLPGLPILPASALMTFVPMTVALIFIYRQRGAFGVTVLLKRTPGLIVRPDWYLVACLFMPVVCGLEFGILRLTGSTLSFPHIAPGESAFLFIAFFIGAVGEEFGWQGYAYPCLREQLNALATAIILGVFWALWHVIPFFQLNRSADWIVWHSLNAIAMRIIIVWLFENNGKSIIAAVLFHTMINLSWALFPVAGSYYDPFIAFLILAPVAGMIAFLWGPATLARFDWGKISGS
jgi:membrane protease YdiL (CAAX protease family)